MAALGGYGRGRPVRPAANNDSLPAPGGMDGGPMRPSNSGSSLNSMDGAGFGRGLPRPASNSNNFAQQSHSGGSAGAAPAAVRFGGFNGPPSVTGITPSDPDHQDRNRTMTSNGAASGFEQNRRNEYDGYSGQLDLLKNRQNQNSRSEPTRNTDAAPRGGFGGGGGGFGSASSNDEGGRGAFGGRNDRGGSGFRSGRGGGFGGAESNQSDSAGGSYQGSSGFGQARGGRGGSNGFGQSSRGGSGFNSDSNRGGSAFNSDNNRGGGFNNDNNRSNRGGFGGGFGQGGGGGFGQSGGFGGRDGERSNNGFSRSSENGGSGAFGNGGQPSRGGFGMRGGRGASGGQGGFGDGGGFGRRNDDRDSNTGNGFGSSAKSYNGGFGGGDNQRDSGFGGRGHGARSGDDGDAIKGPPKASTHVPTTLTEEELFSEERAIAAGEHFDKMFAAINISHKVTGLGKDVPEMRSFEEANLTDQILKNVKRANYTKPTPIQRVAIPIIAEGHDVMGCAQTGSGKTTAFMLPIINWIAKNCDQTRQNMDSPYAIIIGPTRELVKQLFEEGRKFAHSTGVTIAQAYGATSVQANLADLRRGCDIVVATPGRLFDFIARGSIKVNKIRFLVLDEADRMLDQGFKSDVDKFDENPDFPSKDKRTTLMFSATFKDDVQVLARKLLKDKYAFITIGTVGAANHLVQQRVIKVDTHGKKDLLIELLKADYENSVNAEGQKYLRKTLVFVQKKRQADVVAAWLSMDSIKATSIHGDREQAEREKAIFDVVRGDCPVLVATDVCARGLDIKGIEHVINFDLPSDKDTYVHRIGRTARVGHTGKATSFYDDANDRDMVNDIVAVLTEAQQEVPQFLLDVKDNSFGGGRFGEGGDGEDVGSAFGGGQAEESWT